MESKPQQFLLPCNPQHNPHGLQRHKGQGKLLHSGEALGNLHWPQFLLSAFGKSNGWERRATPMFYYPLALGVFYKCPKA